MSNPADIVLSTSGSSLKPNDDSDNAILYLPARHLADSAGSDPKGLLRQCLRFKAMIAMLAITGALGGAAVSKIQSPLYRSHVWLDIQHINDSFLDMRDVSPTANAGSGQELQTQARVLQSETLRRRAIASLTGKTGSHATAVPGVARELRRAPYDPESVRTVAESVQVRTSESDRIVEVTCQSVNPQLAADFANALSDEFIKEGSEWRSAGAEGTAGWLNQQLQSLRSRLQQSEEQLQTYAGESDLVFFASNKDNVTEEKLRQIQVELTHAQADRVSKQARSEMAFSSPTESLPEILDSAPLREYRSKITELQGQVAELRITFEPTYYKVQRVQAAIANLQDAFERERTNLLRRIRNEYEDAKRRESLLTNSYAVQARLVSEQASKFVHYDILKREVDTNRQIYEGVLQKVKQTGVLSALPHSNIRIVDPAEPATVPFRPRPLQNAVIGLLGGVFMGVALASVRGRTTRTFQEPGEAANALGVPELGAIISARAQNGKNRSPAYAFFAPRSGNSGLLPVDDIGYTRPSLLADCFRAAAASLRYSTCNSRVVAIVSAAPDDGKTTITANMGITLASLGSRVLLVDGDFRRPSLHSRFGADNAHGLSDTFRDSGPAPERKLIQTTPIMRLHLLPAGSRTQDTTVLYGERMAELIHRVQHEFDYVLIDTPPMLHIPDARALAKLTDGVVIVIRANQTDRSAVWKIRKRFADDCTPVIGAILNEWNPKNSKWTYYRANSDYGSDE